MMFGHNDFPAVQKIWDDFWEGKNREPVYSITIPKNGKEIHPPPVYLSWCNGDYQGTADALARWYESCEFYGSAIPYFYETFGPDTFSALLGADLSYTPPINDTSRGNSWAVPVLKNLEKTDIHFDPDGKWWNNTAAFHDVLKKRLGDTVMITLPTFIAGLDALSALYSPEALCMALLDVPELVHHALDQINTAYTEIVKACSKLFEIEKYGSITRNGAYSSGIINFPQCDFSCMISPEMFEEFAMQSLRHEFSFMRGGEYHLDGPGALKHLDRLLQIPELDIIQWVPGAGEAKKQDWTDLYMRILKSGKGVVMKTHVDEAEALLKKYNSKKMYIIISGIKSQMQAEDFLAKVNAV